MDLRWEFRAFGQRLDGPRAVLAREGAPEGEEEARTDLYLVAPDCAEASLKLREGGLDLKILRRRRGDLELWEPAARAEFPVDPERLARAFLAPAGLALDPGADPVDAERLLENARAAPGVWTVGVAKRRRRWRLDGVRVELAVVRADGAALESVAVESADAQAVEAARARLGLGDQPNVSYPRLLLEQVPVDRGFV